MRRVSAAVIAASAVCARGQLYGSDNDGSYFRVDESTGVATLIAGDDSTYNFLGGATEIEIDPVTGIGWAQNPGSVFAGNPFHGADGTSFGPSVYTACAFNGLEYIGSTLYGTYVTGGGGQSPSSLAVLDIETGAAADVGPTGVGVISGLAYHESSAVLYGSSGANALGLTSWLLTIDLATGAASPIADMGIVVGSIEFGSDGRLYGGGGRGQSGMIFTIDIASGEPTLLGATGLGTMVTGLSLAPAPGGAAMLGLGWLVAAGRRR